MPDRSAYAARMSRVRRKRPPTSYSTRERRRAPKKLADVPRGLGEEALVVAHGFSAEILAGLVFDGLSMVVTEMREARRGLMIKVERIRITDDGRRAFEA
jgi:hypothetical protein